MGRSKDMDYKTALPDFMAIQRISFSWFISQGLCEELGYFHSTLDFSRTIETFIYSQEYKLTRPIYSSLECKRYWIREGSITFAFVKISILSIRFSF